jgi:ribosome-binding factor A
MKKQKNGPSQLETLAGELREGDGVDPREEAKRKLHRAQNVLPGEGFHQQERLGNQIRTAVEFALQTAATPVLNALTVQDVVQQKGALVVVIVPRDASMTVDLSDAVNAVKQAAAMLRRQVAAEITRKETPNLRFLVLPAGSQELGTTNPDEP